VAQVSRLFLDRWCESSDVECTTTTTFTYIKALRFAGTVVASNPECGRWMLLTITIHFGTVTGRPVGGNGRIQLAMTVSELPPRAGAAINTG
jgi:hypothetical protein